MWGKYCTVGCVHLPDLLVMFNSHITQIQTRIHCIKEYPIFNQNQLYCITMLLEYKDGDNVDANYLVFVNEPEKTDI